MNNGYYQNPVFPGVGLNNNTIPNQQSVPSYEQSQTTVNPITSEQSYIENILRLNRGKKAKFHVTVPGSEKWQDRVFEGIIEQSGRDHLILSNPSTGKWNLILMIYVNYIEFDEKINYSPEFIPNN